jgi:putative redox protein
MAPDPNGKGKDAGPEIEPVTIRSSGGVELRGELARASSAERRRSVSVLFLHSFPSGDVWGDKIGSDLDELCQRRAANPTWNAMTVRFRGCGESGGDFSLARWVDDASAAIRHLRAATEPQALWVCGFGTGGAVGLVAAADDANVTGVVTAGSPADFDDWAAAPEGLLNHSREVGVVRSSAFPPSVERWSAELREVRAIEAAEEFAPRPLLILHGSDDDAVPHFDARALADAHRSAELRFINGAGHNLRLDPRAIAILLGWLDRQALAQIGP